MARQDWDNTVLGIKKRSELMESKLKGKEGWYFGLDWVKGLNKAWAIRGDSD